MVFRLLKIEGASSHALSCFDEDDDRNGFVRLVPARKPLKIGAVFDPVLEVLLADAADVLKRLKLINGCLTLELVLVGGYEGSLTSSST